MCRKSKPKTIFWQDIKLIWLKTLNAQLFLSFEFLAKLFGQELLGFRQPNLIYCLSKGEVDKKKFTYSVSCSLNCRFTHPSTISQLGLVCIWSGFLQACHSYMAGWLVSHECSAFLTCSTAASVTSCRAQATIDPLKPRVSLLFLTMHVMENGAFTACFTMLPSPSS